MQQEQGRAHPAIECFLANTPAHLVRTPIEVLIPGDCLAGLRTHSDGLPTLLTLFGNPFGITTLPRPRRREEVFRSKSKDQPQAPTQRGRYEGQFRKLSKDALLRTLLEFLIVRSLAA